MVDTVSTLTIQQAQEAARESDLLGPPPVIAGEDAQEFWELLERVRDDVKPDDMLEEIWVRDAVELVWEARRLRRLKASVFEVGAHEGLARVLRPFVDSLEADELAEKWLRRHRKLKEVDERLAAAGLSMDAVMAETLASRLDDVERIERMIATVEARLAAALREIDRHRAVLAERLRGATQEIADAEYKELPAPKAAA
jgi:hypothetical protein